MSKPYTVDDVHAWVEMRWERERLDEKVMARIRATVEELAALKARYLKDKVQFHKTMSATLKDAAAHVERAEKAEAERDALKAQVEAARRVCLNTMALGDDDVRPQDILDAMDEAAKK